MTEPGPSHYFDEQPSAAHRPRSVRLVLPGVDIDLATDAGVFAADRVDAGTKLLLLKGPEPQIAGPLLDLGCGYGPIAITLAARWPDRQVWATDVNERALALCRTNAASLAPNVHTAAPDQVPQGLRFAEIWSNPPIHVGKKALHELLLGWLARLMPGGRAQLVVHKHLGSDSLQRWLTAEGWATERLCSRKGYRVLQVEAPA